MGKEIIKAEKKEYKESDLLLYGLGLPEEEAKHLIPEKKDVNLLEKRKKQMKFLDNYMKNAGMVLKSCKEAEITTTAVRYWKMNDPVFAEAYDKARSETLTMVEDELIKRAVEGEEKEMWFQGQYTHTVKEKSDILLMFLTKKLDPSYRDAAQTNIGIAGSEIKISFIDPKPENEGP